MLTFAVGALCAQEEMQQTFTRNILLEQFTTVNCGWCPPGADRITEAIGSSTNVIWIKHHAGFGTDFLTNDIHNAMLEFYGGSTFAPAMMVDRTRFDESNAGPVGSVGQVSEIRGLLSRAKNVTTYCKVYPVEVTYNTETRHVAGQVRGRFGEDNTWDDHTRIVIFLIEDNIVGAQHDYTSHGNWTDYVHMGTVRDAITYMWGRTLEVNESDRTFTFPIDYTLPESYNYRNCKLVAFVYQYNSSDVNSRPVLNAAQSPYLGESIGIAEVDMGGALRLFPNPAESHVVLEAEESIESVSIVNSLGQKVYEQASVNNRHVSVNTEAFAHGIYMVTIRTAKGTSSRKLVVK